MDCGMVREFSEEKRQEIFRMLDEIDNREWKSFMEWCGSSAEEFGNWPDKLAVSAYTRYVDKYHERVLETNEITRNRVNTVFENVAEIDTRYAGRMRECQEKIKEQIAMVRTMTEFMESMTDGKPNMALLNKGSVNENCVRMEDEEENTEIPVVKWEDIIEPVEVRGPRVLAQCLRDHGVTDQDEIDRVLAWIMENNFDLLKYFNNADIFDGYYNYNKEETYNTIMENYIGCARENFLEYAADSEYDGYYDWGQVVYIMQKLRPGLLKDLNEIQDNDKKAEIFESIIKIYNEYRIEQGAIILENFIKENSENINNVRKPEAIVPFLYFFYSDKLIDLYEIEEVSEIETNCQDLIEFYFNEENNLDTRWGKIFYAYTWMQINSIESFTNNNLDNADFDADLEDFLYYYEEYEDVYIDIAKEIDIPPQLIAVIHYRENPQDFKDGTFGIRLHDGHSLNEPYTYRNDNGEKETITFSSFKEAAKHAIQLKQYCIINFNLSYDTTDVVAMVCFTEAYNGMGYYKYYEPNEPNRISPYSFSGTDVYVSGKYISDNNYSEGTIDQQVGTYRLLLAAVAGIYDVEDGKNYVNEMCGGYIQ